MQSQTGTNSSLTHAEVAQLVEHHLAKVRVAGSSLVFRSDKFQTQGLEFFVFVNLCFSQAALVAKLVDAQDLKSCVYLT